MNRFRTLRLSRAEGESMLIGRCARVTVLEICEGFVRLALVGLNGTPDSRLYVCDIGCQLEVGEDSRVTYLGAMAERSIARFAIEAPGGVRITRAEVGLNEHMARQTELDRRPA